MAKSKKDNTDDTPAAEDSPRGTDSIESGDTDGETRPPESGPEDTPETSDAGDTLTASEDTVGSEIPEPNGLGDTVAPADGPDPEVAEAEDDTGPFSEGTRYSEPEVDEVPHQGGDVAAAETDDTLASQDTFESAVADDTLDAAAAPPAAAPVRETVVERKGGFVPMVLGGVVAAAVGYVAGAYPDLPFMGEQVVEEDPFMTETRTALRSQAEQIEALAGRADASDEALAGIDMGEVTGALTVVADDVATLKDSVTGIEGSIASFDERLTALDGRVTELEKQPMEEAVSPETIAAYEREMEALRDELAAQQAEMEAARQDQQAAVQEARAEIEAIAERARIAEASAEERARLAQSRSALAEVTSDARDGRPYAEPLSVLTQNGVDVPAPLAEGADEGLPTLAALISSFPDAARDALAAARTSDASGDADGGLGGFLTRQLGARSVTPREGDSPDAILSRAEASLQGGDLDAALSEISALPEAAQNELSDWVARARLRHDALAAAADLTRQLNQE